MAVPKAPAPTTLPPLDEATLRHHWDRYPMVAKVEENVGIKMLLRCPIAVEGQQVGVTLVSEVQQTHFAKLQVPLQTYLRKAMDTPSLTITTKVDASLAGSEVPTATSTQQEKFDYLKKKYPLLTELQAQLQLDL